MNLNFIHTIVALLMVEDYSGIRSVCSFPHITYQSNE